MKKEAGRKRGRELYASMLGAVMEKPRSVAEISERIQVQNTDEILETLYKMQMLGLVRVAGWAPRPTYRGTWVQVWGFGGEEGVPYPRDIATPPGTAVRKLKPGAELITFAKIIESMQLGGTRLEIAEEVGIPVHRLSSLIRVMRHWKIVHTSGWVPRANVGGIPSEMLTFGPGVDKPRPRAKSRKQVLSEYRVRRRIRERTLDVQRRVCSIFDMGAAA